MPNAEDDTWRYDVASDDYVHRVTGERLPPADWQRRQRVGEAGPALQQQPPPCPPRSVSNIAMVPLPDVLAALTEVGRTWYHEDENVKRFAAHVAERVRGLVNVRDPKELLR